MNRHKFIRREFEAEGTDRSRALALALAEISDPEFLETLLNLKGVLNEHGGQVYIAATRARFTLNDEGNYVRSGQVDPDDPDAKFLSWGYIVHYGSKPTIKRLRVDEEAEPVAAPPEPDEEQEFDGEVEDDGDKASGD